jgi:hypothetical protein
MGGINWIGTVESCSRYLHRTTQKQNKCRQTGTHDASVREVEDTVMGTTVITCAQTTRHVKQFLYSFGYTF